MIQNFVIPGYTPAATLPLKVAFAGGIYDMVADSSASPKDATWATPVQYPAALPLNIDSYVILKAGAGAFPPCVAFSWSGVWEKAIVLGGRVILIPVNFAATTADYPISLSDGVNDYDLTVDALDFTVSVGSFAVSATWKNTLYSIGGQKVAVEGTGMNGVSQILDSEGNELDFVAVSDEWLVLTMSDIVTPGTITITFKSGAGTTLGTTTVVVAGTNELDGEAFFWYDGTIVSVYVDADDALAYVSTGGSIYTGSTPQSDLFSLTNEQEESFVRVVRDKLGKVIAYCPYTIMGISGSVLFTGVADECGVVSITRSALPARFVIRYDNLQVPLRAEWITL